MMGSTQKKLPLYVQIKNKLITVIQEGGWQPGEAIPSESRLMEQYNVSRTTVRQAIRELVHNGILETGRGTPARVKKRPEEGSPSPGVVHHEIGTAFDVSVIRSGESRLHPAAKQALGLADGDVVFFMDRLRLADGLPIGMQQSFFPAAVGEVVAPEAGTAFDYFAVLGRRGIYHTSIQEQVSACNATLYEADLLGISPGEALVTIERTTLGLDRMPLEYSLMKYTPAGFRYSLEIDAFSPDDLL
ncbi:GntR family transcriptional regulator [Alkalicoccus urumqiensis]|nr:GntR family transcriptional regulator [Alkalicoccus urumqiensis]